MVHARRFEHGFTTDFYGLRSFCDRHGYQFIRDKSWYRVHKVGTKGRPKRMTWNAAVREIDKIRIGLGLEPIFGAR